MEGGVVFEFLSWGVGDVSGIGTGRLRQRIDRTPAQVTEPSTLILFEFGMSIAFSLPMQTLRRLACHVDG